MNKFYKVGSWLDILAALRDGIVGLVLFASVFMLLALLVQV